MVSVRWVCSRCLGRLLRTAPRRYVRFHSTITNSLDATISPILLKRARSIAAEHKRLSAENAENYDAAVAKKLGELGPVTAALKEWEDALNSLRELHSLLSDPTSDGELQNLASADIATTTSCLPTLSNNLKNALISPHPFAHLPCLVEIHPGAGGSEASLFASTLLRMYTSLCSRKNWPYTLISYNPDDSGPSTGPGLTSAVLEISVAGTYNILRTESGVHRVQRVPATERKGRTHTSAVSVLVLPSFAESPSDSSIDPSDPNSDFHIPPSEVRSETMRARGAGGQHVNKTDSAIRLTHIPTGLVVSMQESRSQHKNREKAWQVLRAKLAQKRREEREEEIVALRRKAMGGVARMGREDKVRTYNFIQNRVSDHRCGAESGDIVGVLEGGDALEGIMSSVMEWLAEGEVAAVAADAEEEVKRKGHETDRLVSGIAGSTVDRL